MSVLESSLQLAAQKVRLFRCDPNSKLPSVKSFSSIATANPSELTTFFKDLPFNSGIACGKVSENLYLVGVDIDKKDGKNGYTVLEDLEAIGLEFPETWSQKTPTGGQHFLFWSPVAIRQGVDIMGSGVDFRSEGGYLVGPGSSINGGKYEIVNDKPIAQFPKWAIGRYKKNEDKVLKLSGSGNSTVNDQLMAYKRAVIYLLELPPVLEGSRNSECYKAVCHIKDLGVDKLQVPGLLALHWKCTPMLEDSEINITIESAFKTGKSDPGVLAPENIFDTLPIETKENEIDFIESYNQRFFFTSDGQISRVCEQVFIDGSPQLRRYPIQTFHDMMLPDVRKVKIKKKSGDETIIIQKSKEWLKNKSRRSFDHVRFIPTDKDIPGTFNLWRGFRTKPAPPDKKYSTEAKLGLEKFIDHVRENICDGDLEAHHWLMGFAAHLFQRPLEKPPIAVVFQGLKGTGKNIFIDVLHHLIGSHSVTVSGKHTLTSNFNSMMEDKILVALDEAFWSGDKSVEGILKSMITDSKRNIERKGENPYTTTVYDRIFIMGNEDRLVNATQDERRFAVFNVNPRKRGDTVYFGSIMDGVREHGTDELLMRYFLDFDLSGFDIRRAPQTEGLRDQKELSMTNFEYWWQQCLKEGQLLGAFGEPNWPQLVMVKDLYEIYTKWNAEIYPRSFPVSNPVIGRNFRRVSPSCATKKSVRYDIGPRDTFIFGTLEQARADWNDIMKLGDVWE